MNILVCTLGASWPVIPEVFGFLAPQRLDLYANHPSAVELAALRDHHGLDAPDELWICTTAGQQALNSLDKLQHWWRLIGEPLPLRIWIAGGADQLATQAECAHFRELILRVVLSADYRRGAAGQIVLSLAGGRKTMSADMQSAGQMFGATAWLHVVGPEPLPAEIARDARPEIFSAPLPARLAMAVMPLVVGRGSRNELLDIAIDDQRVTAPRFPLPLPAPSEVLVWPMPETGATLTRDLEQRERESSRLLGNYLAELGRTEHFENWRCLYRLPTRTIDDLRSTPLGPQHSDWLDTLPKADLHRHLGGCLNLNAQRRVAQAVWQSLTPAQRDDALRAVRPLIGNSDWHWDWPAQFVGKNLAPDMRAARCAAVLLESTADVLHANLYGATEPRLALKNSERGFAAYERPGELTGSAILGHPAALAAYAQALVEQAVQEGLHYAELRGSPQKYRPHDPGGFLHDLRQALEAAGGDTGLGRTIGPRLAFIWILDRRQRDGTACTVNQAVAARVALSDFLVGLDLAGDEGTQSPDELAPLFAPAFRECLHITIHAGEGEPADNIWQATYHLHADRIGHGLTLADNARLSERFRDRGICLELCPTSNREVVGFADPDVPSSQALPTYPLRALIDAGLPVTLCTDNPGISRTTLGGEYLAAARMSRGGLSQWNALTLIRQGFRHAFVSAAERERLIRTADHHLYALLSAQSLDHAG